MIVPYLGVTTRLPVPSLGGQNRRYRPILAVRLTGPKDSLLRDGLLDTGADDTVFAEAAANFLGVNLHAAEQRLVTLAGRPNPIVCRYVSVQLCITDGLNETYEWRAVVGFIQAPQHYALLGQAGFLQFFSADFDGEAREVTLTAKGSFPGRRL